MWPGIKPASSWILVHTAVPQYELPQKDILRLLTSLIPHCVYIFPQMITGKSLSTQQPQMCLIAKVLNLKISFLKVEYVSLCMCLYVCIMTIDVFQDGRVNKDVNVLDSYIIERYVYN